MEKASPLAMAGAEMSQMLNVQLRDVGFVEVGGADRENDRDLQHLTKPLGLWPALLLAMAFIGLCIWLNKGSAMSFEAPTFRSVGHYRASELIFVDPTELEAVENRLKCHLQPETYPKTFGFYPDPPVMVVSSTDGTVVAMSQPDNLESEALGHLPLFATREAMSQRDKLSRFRPLYSSTNEFLIDLDEKLDLKGDWARAAWITGRSASVRDILTMIGGCDTTALPAKKLIMMGGLHFFDPEVRLPMPFYADQRPGFENNTAEMRPRFKAIQSYLRCHVRKTNCTACCTSLPLSLCDRNSLFECTTAVVTITDKLGMLQAWMGAKPLPGNWSTEWLFPWSSKSSWLDGLLPPYFSHSPNPLPHFLTRP